MTRIQSKYLKGHKKSILPRFDKGMLKMVGGPDFPSYLIPIFAAQRPWGMPDAGSRTEGDVAVGVLRGG